MVLDLIGLTASGTKWEAYYFWDPNDQAALDEFDASVGQAKQLLGKSSERLKSTTSRLWTYDCEYGATNEYREILGEFCPPTQSQEVATAPRAAWRNRPWGSF